MFRTDPRKVNPHQLVGILKKESRPRPFSMDVPSFSGILLSETLTWGIRHFPIKHHPYKDSPVGQTGVHTIPKRTLSGLVFLNLNQQVPQKMTANNDPSKNNCCRSWCPLAPPSKGEKHQGTSGQPPKRRLLADVWPGQRPRWGRRASSPCSPAKGDTNTETA